MPPPAPRIMWEVDEAASYLLYDYNAALQNFRL